MAGELAVGPLGPAELRGRFIALEPLAEQHIEKLSEIAADQDLWRHIPFDPASSIQERLRAAGAEMASGRRIIFAVRRLADSRLVGSTSYLVIAPENARVEIGATWYERAAHGTAVNPEAKYLLLSNAFAAGYNRVEFKTDERNLRSRAALRKLGAREEGILRGHVWVPEERIFRNSVYFSILAAEWPSVKQDLERRLRAFRPSTT